MNKLKFFVFIFFVLFNFNVYASADINVNQYVRPSQSGSTYKYSGLETYNGGSGFVNYSLGTRYTGRLSQLDFSIYPYGFVAGDTYTISLNMASDDWRNNFQGLWTWNCGQTMTNVNATSRSITFVSMKKIKFSFTPTENMSCLRILIKSKNNSSTQYITGVSNWNFSSVVITDPAYNSGGSGGGSTPTPTPTPQPNNQDIINNANQNTEDVINSNNQNTEDVINNANQNTQDIINSNKENLNVCYYNYFDLYSVGQIVSSLGIVERIGDRAIEVVSTASGHNEVSSKTLITLAPDLQIGETYTLSYDASNVQNYIYLTSGFVWYNGASHTITQADLDSTVYFYVSSNLGTGRYNSLMIQKTKGNISNSFISYGEHCYNRADINQKQTNDRLDSINDSINNDDVDDKSSFFTNFQNNTHGLTGIITLPLTTIQSLTNSSCVSLSIPIPFTNSNVSLPCMTQVYQTYIPSVYSIWQVVSFGIISYFICLDIFKIVKGFKDPNEDKVEVLDL